MANHGSKFVSVNLNKSYGQQHQPSHHNRFPHFNGGGGGSSSYGQAGRSRGGSGASGGMVVLSRNRGGPAKVVPKLSVPSPLNLPSLRKEHEKFDISGPGGAGSGAVAGSGARPTSSGVGWTKPVAPGTAVSEKSETGVGTTGGDGVDVVDGGNRGIGSYMPPSARLSGAGAVGSNSDTQSYTQSVEKAVLLRGEDFPSLQAARPVSAGASQKQREALNQKQKQKQKQKQTLGKDLIQDKRDSDSLGPLVDMHPTGRLSRNMGGKNSVENSGEGRAIGGGQLFDHSQRKEGKSSDPLPLVSVISRSDWTDDERDTGRGLMERGRDYGYSNPENFWDRDFDLPRPSVLPHKPAQNQFNRWGQRDNETGKNFTSEVLKVDPFNRDVRTSSREGRESNKWRNSTFSKDGFSSQEGHYNADIAGRTAGHNNLIKENRYPSHSGDMGRDGNIPHNRDSAFGRREWGLAGRQQQQQRNYSAESFTNRGSERHSWDLHASEQSNRSRGIDYQNNALTKSSFGSGKMPLIADPILTMGLDKRFSKGDRPFTEDHFLRDYGSADFDDKGDIFSEGLVGVIKRKKDAAKPTDFHDPVRESFEAELERVQKMQELERQRIIEEQEKALEQARREEEDRQRRVREEEEHRRRLEDEAREAVWRAEQERVEAIQRAEEQKIAREDERKKIQLEEERRKQAARQKLEELEAKIAQRQTESSKGGASVSKTIADEKLDSAMQEKHVSRNLDLVDTWEDSERVVENLTVGSFDSSIHNRSTDMSVKPYPPREGASSFADRGKATNSWRRDAFENGGGFPSSLPDQEIGAYNPTRGAIGGSRAAYRKEIHGGVMSSRPYMKAGMQEPFSDDFGYQKEHRWSFSGNADSYGKLREMDSDFPDNIADKYNDSGWGLDYSRGNNRPPFPERLYPHSEANELYSYGRSRYFMRQPRVLPPPLASAQRSGAVDHSHPPTFQDNNIHYAHTTRAEPIRQAAYYGGNQGGHEPSEIFELERENVTNEEQKLNNASRCESQSSLSVSSPPTSPPHLSHDELDESGESLGTSAVGEGRISLLTGSVPVNQHENSGNGTNNVSSDSISVAEDEEWALENDDRMQQQEEYDEDENGYREEDEVREGDDDNLDLSQKFEGLELNDREPLHTMDNVVLGFDEGIQVVIPSDCSENVRIQERSFGVPTNSDNLEGKAPSDGQCVLPTDEHMGTGTVICSGKAPEKSALHGTIGQSTSSLTTVDASTDASGIIGLTARPTVPSSGDSTSVSSQANLPSSSSENQGEPIKLQFGLFSGPSLIPSPVPAIQIGSIQMPLHIHPPSGPSITHMHPSQHGPVFQFGQLHYASPISQGILPIPQSMSFAQPNMISQLNLNQNTVGSVTGEPTRAGSEQIVMNDEEPSVSMNKQRSLTSEMANQSQGLNKVVDGRSQASNVVRSTLVGTLNEKTKSEYVIQAEERGNHHTDSRTFSTSSKFRGSAQSVRQPIGGDRNFGGQRGVGQVSGGRGKRFAYVVKNSNTKPSFQDHDMPADSNGFQRRPPRYVQRTEFRIRDNNDRKPTISSSNTGLDDKSNTTGKAVGSFARSGSKRGAVSCRTIKHNNETEPSASGNIGDRAVKELTKNLTNKVQSSSYAGEPNSRIPEEDVDAPLQSGVVRVFKQSGIEIPSDEDDFIEVRSKRQMLNDRREQREKESKAKSRINKPPRKPRYTRQMELVSRTNKKISGRTNSEDTRETQLDLDLTKSVSPQVANRQVSPGFNATASQPPIGTPAMSYEAKAVKQSQAASVAAFFNGKTESDPIESFDSKDKVMPLSQSQVADAIKPTQYDARDLAVGSHSTPHSDQVLPTSSLTKDKSLSSGASTINSLLAGQRIQFGAVTSPTVLPGSRIVSNVIGSPAPGQSDGQMLHNFPVTQRDDTLFIEKEKQLSDSCAPIQDSEAEAEAAASAVAVAAITSDEIVGNGLESVNDTKSFGGTDIDGIAAGAVGDQHMASQSRGEELLNVSLPADLSVETTPISIWPPLPSPQSSSSQMLSHFPGGPPSHFPFYEMNPLLGGPIFAFSPQEESSGTQSQPQKSTSSNSGPLVNWQQSHSGVDSFYGPPTGYPGPFIGPPRGIPGVQGPPHMVVYNHFAPVGQYGQVGLSFMGTTYIPSGKQPDWKNGATTAPMPISEGDMNNVKMANVPRDAPNMTAPTQRLAPGSPLLPMPSPMPMFDVSSFQTPDLSVQPHWGHIPASPLHPVPVSRPLQPQVENALPPQVNHTHPIDQSLPPNRFPEPRAPTSSGNGQGFPIPADKNVTPFPSELGLGDPLRSTSSPVPTTTVQSSSGKIGTSEDSKHQNAAASSVKQHFPQKNAHTQPANNTASYRYQRGGMSHRNNNPGSEWTHRRMGFRGRNPGLPTSSKVKQIYVAKQTNTAGNSTT